MDPKRGMGEGSGAALTRTEREGVRGENDVTKPLREGGSHVINQNWRRGTLIPLLQVVTGGWGRGLRRVT